MALLHADRSALVQRLRAAGCVYAEDEADLLIAAADSAAALTDLVDRRVAGRPLEHLLGWAEFCGLRGGGAPGGGAGWSQPAGCWRLSSF
ncbi:hypothetical protein ACWEVO_32380, partial [Micromonospora sp. NPDC003776]